MPNREKVMSWLEGLAEPDWRECYSDSEVQETARQALDLIDELMKEQETSNLYKCPNCGTWVSAENVVRCKDCKHGEKSPTFRYYPEITWCNKHSTSHNEDWFCADGIAKDKTVLNK